MVVAVRFLKAWTGASLRPCTCALVGVVRLFGNTKRHPTSRANGNVLVYQIPPSLSMRNEHRCICTGMPQIESLRMLLVLEFYWENGARNLARRSPGLTEHMVVCIAGSPSRKSAVLAVLVTRTSIVLQ